MVQMRTKTHRKGHTRRQSCLDSTRCTGPLGEEHFNVPPSLAGPKSVFVTCHYCGYGPAKIPTGGVCPKCGGHSWERFCLSDKLHPELQLR